MTFKPRVRDYNLETKVSNGHVHLKSQFILNGVCVLWRGYIDLVRLDGVGCLEFDRARAEVEASLLREQVEQNSRRVHEFEDRRRQQQQQQQQLDQERHERQERQERQASSEAEVVEALLRFSEAPQSGNPSCSPSSSSMSQSHQHQHQHHHQQQSHHHHHQHLNLQNDHNHNHHLS
ncbi:core-binding factor subunit beta [Elysia marginata]|uniref:Core-binding factor subunit beta n=1 Tax=Elysia marginata TaxID=1093978 RepID=A0AAV4J0D0_9GAST|nr:core-binding factor subunit beta [Elysia marginata]